MMKHLYVLGGRRRKDPLKTATEEVRYEKALIIRLDTETRNSEVCVEYDSPAQARAGDDASILFKCGDLSGNKLYACTGTEVLIYQVPDFARLGYISLPCFNDVHHVCRTPENSVLVANTGLDMVVEVSPRGEVLREWSTLGEDPWKRFSGEIDYRKVASTKPHLSHPNFVFQTGKEIWVTRWEQKDAICLTRPGTRIVIGIERPHDGHVHGGKAYFTTVDGNIVIVDLNTLNISAIIDLKTIDNERKAFLGWCRGLMVEDDEHVWVGFTRVRDTTFKENINWVKHVFRESEMPTHIALYDISKKKCLTEIDLELHGLNIVFSMFPAR